MAVVKNLMVRAGADFSGMRKEMQRGQRDLATFKASADRSLRTLPTPRVNTSGMKRELASAEKAVASSAKGMKSSFSSLQGENGIGGMLSSLGKLSPALGSAATRLEGLAGSAGKAAKALGPVGIAIGGTVAALVALIAVSGKASQEAIKYEASLGRVNMQLKGGTRAYMEWARAQGLAKTSAAEMGATYSVLLSSFTNDTATLTEQTRQMVQATRVVASATGRSIEDVTDRMRSGLLGNTEAIEDLGVFVNVSMIESTQAFKKFANGKHWDQLEFQTQQQIRLQAILEQSYARYGNKLQNNVMTKQTALLEQLKDIKLNLSQAFLPIWNAVLPALTKLAQGVANVTENLARLSYFLAGKDYDKETNGLDQQADSSKDAAKGYDELADSAKAARKELAAFDQLNLLGSPSDGGSGSGSGGSNGSFPGGSTGGGGGIEWPSPLEGPPAFNKKWKIQFDTPSPPDAGAGAVATAVVATINSMVAAVRAKLAEMWGGLGLQTQVGLAFQDASWRGFVGGLTGAVIPAFATAASLAFANLWKGLNQQAATAGASIRTAFQGALTGMLGDLQVNGALIRTNWEALKVTLSSISNPLAAIRTDWKGTLTGLLAQLVALRPSFVSEWGLIGAAIAAIKTVNLPALKEGWRTTLADMQAQLNAIRPALVAGLGLVGTAINALKSPLADLKKSWSTSLADMYTSALGKLPSIVTMINSVISAWNRMKQALTGAASAIGGAITDPFKDAFGTMGSDLSKMFSADTFDRMWDKIKGEAAKPENQIVAGVVAGSAAGVAAGASGIAAEAGTAMKSLFEMLKGLGIAVPALASGGLAYGPTLAMVGDNRGAASNPEVIAPLSELADYMGGGDDSQTVSVLYSILQAIKDGQKVSVSIDKNAVGAAAISVIDDHVRRTGSLPFPV